MRTILLPTLGLIALLTAPGAVTGAEHTGRGSGVIQVNPGRYDDTRIKRPPQLVQKRVVSKEPIKKWVPDPGYEYINEKNPSRPPKGRWITTGYHVTYIEVYDNGTSKTYTVTE